MLLFIILASQILIRKYISLWKLKENMKKSLLLLLTFGLIILPSQHAFSMKRANSEENASNAKKPKAKKVSPLCQAIQAGNQPQIDALLAIGCDGTEADHKHVPAVLYAVEKGNLGLVQRLSKAIECGSTELKARALVLACLLGHEDIARYFLDEKICSVEAQIKSYYLRNFNSVRDRCKNLPDLPADLSPLCMAAMTGSLPLVDLLIKAGAPALSCWEQARVILLAYASASVTRIFKTLLEAQKLVQITQSSVALSAIEHKNDELFACIMQLMVASEQLKLLFDFAKKNDTTMVEKIRAYCSEQKRAARVIFEGALAGRHYDVVRTHVKQKLVQLDEPGLMLPGVPLWYASREGDMQAVTLLLMLGALWIRNLRLRIIVLIAFVLAMPRGF